MANKYYKPYTMEIRDRALQLIKKKKKLKNISKLLNVSTRTLLRWKKFAKSEIIEINSNKIYTKRGKKPEINYKIVSLLLKNYPDANQKEIASAYFHFTGKLISQSSISKYINKIPKINKMNYKENGEI